MTYLDPVQLVRNATDFSVGEKAVAQILAEKAGYIVQAQPLSDLTEALFSGSPLLVEGDKGAGKTALAEAMSLAFGMPLFCLSCADGLDRESILYKWNRDAQRIHLEVESQKGRDISSIVEETFTKRFLDLGPVTAALDASNYGFRPVLLIDEIDKLGKVSDLLLQALARFTVNVEFLQPFPFIKVESPDDVPLVILTSNNLRDGVSVPLRNRGLYTYLESPVLKERINILHIHSKGIGVVAFLQLIVILELIPSLRLTDPPTLRNATRLARTLSRKNVESLTLPLLKRHLCYLATNQGDIKRLQSQLANLYELSLTPSPEIIQIVGQLFQQDEFLTDEAAMSLAAAEFSSDEFLERAFSPEPSRFKP